MVMRIITYEPDDAGNSVDYDTPLLSLFLEKRLRYFVYSVIAFHDMMILWYIIARVNVPKAIYRCVH